MKTQSVYREMKEEEKDIIDFLLKQDFPARDEIKEQIENAAVKSVDCACNCLSIEFSTTSKVSIPAKQRIPVEASYKRGEDYFEILLHVLDGKVHELEFVTYAEKADLEYPKVSNLRVTINEKV